MGGRGWATVYPYNYADLWETEDVKGYAANADARSRTSSRCHCRADNVNTIGCDCSTAGRLLSSPQVPGVTVGGWMWIPTITSEKPSVPMLWLDTSVVIKLTMVAWGEALIQKWRAGVLDASSFMRRAASSL